MVSAAITEEVEVIGVMDGEEKGQLELLQANELKLFIAESLWEPLEQSLSKGNVKVTIERIGQKVTKII